MSIFDWLKIVESLSEKDKENLETFCQIRNLMAWDILFHEWEDANSMYFLKRWSIEIYKETDGKKVKIWKVDAEEILWEMALFGWTGKRMATAEAIVNTQLITILSFSIKELTEKYPNLMIKIQNVIEERNMNNKVLENFS